MEKAMPRVEATQWLRKNRAALFSSNDYVEEHGLPLKGMRQF
jgi:post-segregation antitoxin (ccd killing protein)